MKRALVVFLLLAVAAISPTVAKKEEKSDTSHEIAYYNFMEISGDITLMVYSFPAHWRAKAKAIPLWITVGMRSRKGGKEPLEFGLANFVLVDSEGNSYPTVESSKLWDIYKEQMSDQNVMRERPVSYGNYFDLYTKITGALYPAARNMRLSGNTIELDAFTVYSGMFYFPQPKAGLKGVMAVRMEGGAIETPIEVKFKVPK
jgi:hypothetical protein